jgi:hypothetical protein
MAKQTFTTGQVLTAAQMTSLQQTAMLGGSASAKVASYVLVAADAGTSVSMSNAGATTITVNTGLFAAGDTVTILNVGAGTCTITAGSATVSKATNATLALVTNAGGVLYFTATGAATFLPFDVGAAAASSTKNFSLIGSASLTAAATITISGISNQDVLLCTFENASSVNGTVPFYLRFNADSGANYNWHGISYTSGTTYSTNNLANTSNSNNTEFTIAQGSSNAASLISGYAMVQGGATAGVKTVIYAATGSAGGGNSAVAYTAGGWWNNTATITSVSFISQSGNFDNGTFRIYGSA